MSILDDIDLDQGAARPIGLLTAAQIPAGGGSVAVMNRLRSDQLVDVLLVTRDTGIKDKVTEAFLEKNFFNLRAVSARVIEFHETLDDFEQPHLLIIDLNTANVIDTEALERIKKSKYAEIPIIVISSYLDQDTVRSLVQIKVDDWLPKDCTPLDIYKSCERVFRAPPAAKTEHNAKCYTFLPVSGGAGCTTLAIEAALYLGKKNNQLESTCLVDLNFQDGSVADYLDLTPAFRIQDLSTAPGRLDRQLLEVMLARHSSGLSVLAAPRVHARCLDVSEGLVASVLGLLSRSFDVLVMDLPKVWFSWTDNVIWGSDKVFIVTPFIVPALRQTRFIADAVAAKTSTAAQVLVIVNKYHEPLFSSGLMRKDAERILGQHLGGFIPEAGDSVTEAINRGVPVSKVGAGNKIEKRLAEILELEEVRAKR
jgi:pilus assembly protein CpaE